MKEETLFKISCLSNLANIGIEKSIGDNDEVTALLVAIKSGLDTVFDEVEKNA